MNKINIYLNSFDKIKKFVNVTCKLECDLNLISGRCIVDGKSIIGIFSLDLSKPIEMNINNTQNNLNDILEKFESFLVTEEQGDILEQ